MRETSYGWLVFNSILPPPVMRIVPGSLQLATAYPIRRLNVHGCLSDLGD